MDLSGLLSLSFSIGNLIDTNLISSNNNRNELSEQAVGQGFVVVY